MCDSRECAQLTQAARSLPEQPHPAEGAGCPASAHPDSETAMSLRTGVPAGRAFRSLRPQRLCRWPLRPSCLRPGSLRWGHCHARARRARLWARPAVGHVRPAVRRGGRSQAPSGVWQSPGHASSENKTSHTTRMPQTSLGRPRPWAHEAQDEALGLWDSDEIRPSFHRATSISQA